ncbi:MAG: transposase [Candidatus Omnitrophica bacterium]|nr:transposase [Candidatus Omnitrophota bacterium]
MPYRKIALYKNGIYHIFTRSIAGFKIFNSDNDYERMCRLLFFYAFKKTPCKFSLFSDSANSDKKICGDKLIGLLAYCLMPTHLHLLVEQFETDGISRYVNLVLKSYSAYFNIKFKRRGPLWEGRFKNVLVDTDEKFLHLTRYIHLNPVTASLVEKPHDWKFSSYKEYIREDNSMRSITCDFFKYFDMEPESYIKFVEDRINYQRELEYIKHLIIEQ